MSIEPEDNLMVKLNDSNLTLFDPAGDVRGRDVINRDGDKIGHVSDLYVDREEARVRFLDVAAGGFLGLGERHFLVPVDAVTNVTSDRVYVDQTLEHFRGAPEYDPRVVPRGRGAWEPYYGHFGFRPYWSADYAYPRFPANDGGIDSPRDADDDRDRR